MNKLTSVYTVNRRDNLIKFENLQARLDFQIENAVKHILIDFNVAKPLYTFYVKNNITFNLNCLFGFSGSSYSDFEMNYDAYMNRMPNSFYPIGSVDGGDLLCASKYSDYIFYWFHETDDWSINSNVKEPIKVGEDLYEFLNGLVISEVPSELEIAIAKSQSKITITPVSVKIRNEQRIKAGLKPLSMEEWYKILNNE